MQGPNWWDQEVSDEYEEFIDFDIDEEDDDDLDFDEMNDDELIAELENL